MEAGSERASVPSLDNFPPRPALPPRSMQRALLWSPQDIMLCVLSAEAALSLVPALAISLHPCITRRKWPKTFGPEQTIDCVCLTRRKPPAQPDLPTKQTVAAASTPFPYRNKAKKGYGQQVVCTMLDLPHPPPSSPPDILGPAPTAGRPARLTMPAKRCEPSLHDSRPQPCPFSPPTPPPILPSIQPGNKHVRSHAAPPIIQYAA